MQAAPKQVFDPYRVWLGIPPEEQPPNHYRLLGIGLFENQPDVIANAADRQMGHLRTFQSGKHSPISQRILNEVAAAKLCLLNSAKKAAYDQQLQSSLSEDGPVLEDSSPWADIADQLPSLSLRGKSGATSVRFPQITWKRLVNLGPMLAVAATGVLVLIAMVVWITAQKPDKASVAVGRQQPIHQLPEQPKADVCLPIGSPPVPSKLEAPSPPRPPEKPPAIPQPAAPTVAIEKPADVPKKVALLPVKVPVTKPVQSKPVPKKPAGDQNNPPKQPEKKRPVPDDAIQQRIATQLVSVYNPSHAKTPADKIKLANQLLKTAKASNPNEQYVLLRRASEIARQAGDVVLTLQAIEAMDAQFEINATEEKAKSLLDIAPTATKPDQIRAIYGSSQQVIAQALTAGRCELASEVADSVLRACQRPKGKEFRKNAIDQREWVREYCRHDTQRQAAETMLKGDAEDVEAHLVLGRHFCFFVDDWKKGLPHLAKGDAVELRQLAERELAPPTEPNEQIKLADAWWELGQSCKSDDRDSILLRAGYWYDLARTSMAPGLTRLRADKRVEELTEIRRRRAADPHRHLLHSDDGSSKDLWNGLF